MALQDPRFVDVLWKATPASFAARLSRGRWFPWPYLQLLSRKLVDVAAGRCRRLIVTMPPRHGKSEMVSHWFPAWYMEMFQDRRIILASYEADFAAKWGAKVRDTLSMNQDELTMRFKSKMPAQHFWETSGGGAMMCAGVNGPITGKGANVFIIDDFVKNSEEAWSKVMRDKTWDWWTSTARTRLEPNGAVIIMATRWHSDDLIGRVINPKWYSEKGTREEWEVFNFPAIADPESDKHYAQFGVSVNNLRLSAVAAPKTRKQTDQWHDILGRKLGDALCPDRYDGPDLANIRSAVGERDWYSLYQQRPGDDAEDGNVYYAFNEEDNLRVCQFNDRLPLGVSIDFNVDPMSAVVFQYDQGSGLRMMEKIWFLEELVLPDSNVYKLCDELAEVLKKYVRGYSRQIEVYGDAAGTQRSSSNHKTNWQIVADSFALHPVFHVRFLRRKANPTIGDRVNAVNTMLRAADGTVRMWIDSVKCPKLVNDFKKVRWAEDSSGNKLSLLDKSNPELTHISDAAGYAVEYRFSLKIRAGGRSGMLQ